jgi:putative flippase GtrA
MTSAIRRLVALYWDTVFAKFLIAGGLAAVVNFLSRLVLQPIMGFEWAVALAFLVGFLTGFLLNRVFVFPRSGKPVKVEMAWFFLFNLLAFPVVVVGAVILRDFAFRKFLSPGPADAAAHGCAILTPVLFNFAAHRLITFKAHGVRFAKASSEKET